MSTPRISVVPSKMGEWWKSGGGSSNGEARPSGTSPKQEKVSKFHQNAERKSSSSPNLKLDRKSPCSDERMNYYTSVESLK